MKRFLIIFAFFFFSCSNEVPNPASEEIFNNPLDEEEVEYDLPALTFYPVEVDVAAGTSFGVDVFALGFENLAGTSIRITFDENRITSASVIPGTIFEDAQNDPLFFSEVNAEDGWINLTASFLGSDSAAVSTTGSVAQLTFTAVATGDSKIQFGTDCEMVDPDDVLLEINGFGEASITAN